MFKGTVTIFSYNFTLCNLCKNMSLSWVSSLTLTAHHKFFIDFIFENYVDL
jgi:hypothetical protein